MAVLTAVLLGVVGGILSLGEGWTVYDDKLLDPIYRLAVTFGRGPATSNQIVYLVATDETYRYFGKNYLDRADIARVNRALTDLAPGAVAFDIIFAYPGHPQSDLALQSSLDGLPQAYLPIGVDIASRHEPLKKPPPMGIKGLQQPSEAGQGTPYFAQRLFLQNTLFSKSSKSTGHICASGDPDGTYRHQVMLVRVDEGLLPSLSLAMFLDYSGVTMGSLQVHWGESITIPAPATGLLKEDLTIPIDPHGKAFIPYPQKWGRDFPAMTMHRLLETYANENLRGNLLDFFEGKFVLVGDVATGVSDIGNTTLEADTPLISQHTAMLNAMLNGHFYTRWTRIQTLLLIVGIGLFFGFLGMLRASWVLYLSGGATLAGLALMTLTEINLYRLFPLATVSAGAIVLFIGLIAGMEIMTGRERRFIKTAFSRYVPEKVVESLLADPGILKLGGEKREMTVLFSDIDGFTGISEKVPVDDLVYLLNTYLTAMTDIVLGHGGIIDKYEGDAIMAEFGAPLALPDHADRAVSAALTMQRKLIDMQGVWTRKGLPGLSCRIGVNTGTMVVGNMGSEQVFDFTVIGDAVNLAARLESANKLYGTKVMISEFTLLGLTPGKFKVRKLDRIRVKGKTEAVTVFEVYEKASRRHPEGAPYYTAYKAGFEAYLNQDFETAKEKFAQALELKPDDLATALMIARVKEPDKEMQKHGWDGAVSLKVK